MRRRPALAALATAVVGIAPTGASADTSFGQRLARAAREQRRSEDGQRPLLIHNIGAGAQIEDVLFAYPVTGHYRWM